MTKTVLVLLLATVATNAELHPRGVFEDAEAALDKYQITVQTVLRHVSDTFQETYAHVQQTGDAIASIAIRIINIAQTDLLEQLRELERTTQAQGVDPSSCTVEPRLELVQMPALYRAQIDGCINSIIRASYYTIQNAFTGFSHLNDTIDEYADRIETCRTTNDEICALLVTAQISLHNELLPIVLEGDIQDVVNQFSNMEPNFQTCSRGPSDEINTRGRIIMETALRCVENLLDSRPK